MHDLQLPPCKRKDSCRSVHWHTNKKGEKKKEESHQFPKRCSVRTAVCAFLLPFWKKVWAGLRRDVPAWSQGWVPLPPLGQGSPLQLPISTSLPSAFSIPPMFSEMHEVASFTSGTPLTALCSSDGRATEKTKQCLSHSAAFWSARSPSEHYEALFPWAVPFPSPQPPQPLSSLGRRWPGGTPRMQQPGPAEPGVTATSIHSSLHCLRIYISIPVNNVEELPVETELLMVTVKLFSLQKSETAYSLSGAFRLPQRLKHFC